MPHNWLINLLLKFCAKCWQGRSKEDPGEGMGRKKRIPLLASAVGIRGGGPASGRDT